MEQWEIPTPVTRNCVLPRVKAHMKMLLLTFNLHYSVNGILFLDGDYQFFHCKASAAALHTDCCL